PQTRWTPCRGVVPFARGSHRQVFPRRAEPRGHRLAPCAGSARAAADFHASHQKAGPHRRGRGCSESACTFCQASRCRAQRRAGPSRRCRGCEVRRSNARRGDAGRPMSIRILHLFVIVALIVAAAYVYDIKFEATMQAEQLSKLRGEIRRERDAVAALRAEWAKLVSPARVESLAQRHLPMKPAAAIQV